MYFNMNIGYGDLSLQDWREIRAGDYWEIRDSLSGLQRENFIHGRIERWQRNKLKQI